MKIYLDYAATTPVDERVFSAMKPYFCTDFGNPNSVHSFGRKTADAVDESRRLIAKAINAKKSDVFFTSGGSEANNWAIKCGHCELRRNRILVSAIEHPSIIEAVAQMTKRGYEVEHIPVLPDGTIDLDALSKMLDDRVSLVSVMLVNNETGVVQPVKEIAKMAHKVGAYFHTDAVQALASENIDFKKIDADFMTISSHKIYGPKGVGALIVKSSANIDRLIAGGHQERTLRGGTTNTAGVVGFAKAIELVEKDKKAENSRIDAVKSRFIDSIVSDIVDVTINGSGEISPNIVNLQFGGIDGKVLLQRLDINGVACSAGAACSAGSIETSAVLSAMGLSKEKSESSLRFSFGRFTTDEEITAAVKIIASEVRSLRNF